MANVLLVEDAELVRFALSALLTDGGHKVTEASDGNAAVKAMQEGAYDVVVTDIFMPGMDGIELIRQLQSDNPEVKIVAISGGAARQLPTYAMKIASKLGADVVMQKPVENELLLAEIDTLCQ